MTRTTLDPDRTVPALIVKIGHYPLQHIGLGVARTLGRIGVPVYTITEDRWAPTAISRYCAGYFVQHSTGREDPEELVSRLVDVGRKLGCRAVAFATDEEAAVLLAEYATELSEYFVLPQVTPELPRKLASKRGLYELCREFGVPAPTSAFPQTIGEVHEFADRANFPVVAKNLEAWVRRSAPVVPGSTAVLWTRAELLALAARWGEAPSVILQDYIPREDAEDWIVHLYCDANSDCVALFTGLKIRSWPPHAGMTACAYIVDNPGLAQMAQRFCKDIGFRGVADLDWRLDRRDGEYKLVDFNPRVGSQFRLFETAAGIDVVRAMHLDLTGRPVPPSPQLHGRRIIVENMDALARVFYRPGSGYTTPAKPRRPTSTELAWFAWDDPLPLAMMSVRSAGPLATYAAQALRSRAMRRQAEKAARAGEHGPDRVAGPPGAATPPAR